MSQPTGDIVLTYQTSRRKQVFVLTFCTVAAIGLWIGAWASMKLHAAPVEIPALGFISSEKIFVFGGAVYTFFMLPLMLLSIWLDRRSFGKIVLGETGITLPAKWSGRPLHLDYASIERIDERVIVGSRRLQRIGGVMTMLQLTCAGRRVGIIVENLPSRSAAELIIQTWIVRHSLVGKIER